MHMITRREFLRATGAAAGYELSRHLISPSVLPIAQAEPLPSVVVSRGTNADSAATILKTAIEGLGGISRFVKPGQVVAIKPNATWAYPPNTASSTDPELLRALIQMVRDAGARRIILMDHCSIDPGTAECLRESGIGEVLDQMRVEKVFPDRYLSPKELFTTIELPKGKSFKKIGVIKAAVEADVRINMGVAKCHLVTKLTMCLKHMMGFLEVPAGLHADLEQGIADINSASQVQAQLHILEAIRVRLPIGASRQAGGYETDISHPNKVKRLNQIVAGIDPVLIDAYGCINYFSVKPQELTHVKLAYEDGLGEIDVDKAVANGQLRFFTAGQPIATPTPKATATPTIPSTGTPLPTATPMPEVEATPAPAPVAAAGECVNTVNPNSFLSGALIPAAAILAGAGIIARRQMRRNHEGSDEQPTSE